MPTTDRMNRTRLTNSSANDPLNGIRNGPAAAAIIRSPSMVPMTSAGKDLDRMISGVEVGETSNWSKVPSSRSRAIDSEVMSSALKNARMPERPRSEEHTSELQSLMRLSYAVFCLKKKKQKHI